MVGFFFFCGCKPAFLVASNAQTGAPSLVLTPALRVCRVDSTPVCLHVCIPRGISCLGSRCLCEVGCRKPGDCFGSAVFSFSVLVVELGQRVAVQAAAVAATAAAAVAAMTEVHLTATVAVEGVGMAAAVEAWDAARRSATATGTALRTRHWVWCGVDVVWAAMIDWV